jgi:hypothetical protein
LRISNWPSKGSRNSRWCVRRANRSERSVLQKWSPWFRRVLGGG